MDGTRIVMVRHGESLAQERRIVGGHKGCEGLSVRGRLQVEALRDRWKASDELGGDVVLYASLMPRAIETAEILAPVLGLPEISQDCDFCEHHPGEGDGLPWDEFDERYPHPAEWDPRHAPRSRGRDVERDGGAGEAGLRPARRATTPAGPSSWRATAA